MKTNKDGPIVSAAESSAGSLVYKVCADICAGSLEMRRQRTEGWRVNACVEHLLWLSKTIA